MFSLLVHCVKMMSVGAATLAAAAIAHAATDIQAALDTAAPGDTIQVAAGSYGVQQLGGVSFDEPVTLVFDENAYVERLILRFATGVHFDNLHIESGPATNPHSENALMVFGGGDILFRRASFAWARDGDPLNDGTLLVFDGVAGVAVKESHFSDAREALMIRSSQDVQIIGNHFTEILEDAIVIAGSDRVTIDQNLCTDFTASADPHAHPDCIQLQAGGRAVANTDVTISNNVIMQGVGDKAQPIFIGSRHIGVPHIGVVVEKNVTRQSTAIGIHIGNTNDLVVRGNQVLPSTQADAPPRILVRAPGENILIEDNIAAQVRGPVGAIVQNNTIPN
ncbi:MAG: right-handed parallel beta-helix repeat-containing protein [Pseudomonadota bacterium]